VSASSARTGRSRHWIKPLLVQLGGKAAVLVTFAVLLLAALVALVEFRPIAAARDAILNEHMWEQAYWRKAPDMPGSVAVVAFDEDSCRERRQIKGECQLDGLIDRRWIAETVRIAAAARPAAILIDVTPRLAECDAGTEALVSAILEASLQMPVIMVRPLLGDSTLRQSGQTLFEQCSRLLAESDHARFARGEGVFFGHAFLRASERGGPIDSVRPWVSATIPGLEADGVTAGSAQSVRLPAVGLIAGLAMQLPDQQALFKVLQESGLETRWRANQDVSAEPKPLLSCRGAGSECMPIRIGGSSGEAAPMRINFRFGWSRDHRDLNYGTLTPISAIDFNDRRAADMRKASETGNPAPPTVILIASAMPELGDFHNTSIGQLPGGVINANAAFAFSTEGGILNEPGRLEVFLDDLKHLGIFVAEVVAGTVALALVFYALGRLVGRSPEPATVVELAWPCALGGIAIYDAVEAWSRLHEDFEHGILSLALVGTILALSKLLSACEEALAHLVSFVVERVSGHSQIDEEAGPAPRSLAPGE
jgi:hypothetical protein